MANWTMLGNSIGQGFNQGFTKGVDDRLEEEQKKRYQQWLWNKQEEQRKKLQDEYAQGIANIFKGSNTFDSNTAQNAIQNTLWGDSKQQPFSFDNQPVKLSLTALQEPQQAPNQSFKLFGGNDTNGNSSLGSLSFGTGNSYADFNRLQDQNTFNYTPPVSTSDPTAMRNAITRAALGGNFYAAQMLDNFANDNLLPKWTERSYIDENGNTWTQGIDQFGNRGELRQTGKAALGTKDYVTPDGRKWRINVDVNGREVGEPWQIGWSDLELAKARLGSGSGAKNSYTTDSQMLNGILMDGSFNKQTGEFTPTAVNQKWVDDVLLPDMAKHLGRNLTMDEYYNIRNIVSSTGNLELAKNYLNRGRPDFDWTPWNTENDEQLLKEWDDINLSLLPFGYADKQWLNERFKEIYFQSKELQKYIKQLNNPELNAVVEQIIDNLNANIPDNAQPVIEEDLKNITGLE